MAVDETVAFADAFSLATLVADETSTVLSIPSALLEPLAGTAIALSVVLTNFMGASAKATASVSVAAASVPSLAFVGGPSASFAANAGAAVVAEASAMSCDGPPLDTVKLAYDWTLEPADAAAGVSSASKDPRHFVLAPHALTPGDYALTVTVSDARGASNAATKVLSVTPSPLSAAINGAASSAVVVGVAQPFRLDGSDSADPDGSALSFACVELNSSTAVHFGGVRMPFRATGVV